MLITLYGEGGEGKGTIGLILANHLGYRFVSVGGLMRAKAQQLNLTFEELEERMRHDHGETDHWLDDETKRIGDEENNVVVDGRLAWHFIPQSIKIKLVCVDKVRFERLAKRDKIDIETAKLFAETRQMMYRARYKAQYGIENLGQDSDFDVTFDTTNLVPEKTADLILEFLVLALATRPT